MKVREKKKLAKNNKSFCPIDMNKENVHLSGQKAQKIHKPNNPTDLKERRNQSYDFMISHKHTKIDLPQLLKPKIQQCPQIQHYECDILEYIIKQQSEYEFNEMMKKKIRQNRKERIEKIDRIFKIFQKLRLKRKTFELAVYYYDKYTSQSKNKRQPSNIEDACILIAMKYQEIYPPEIKKWTTTSYSRLIELQSKVLPALNFKLAYTTTQDYLQFYYSQNPKSKEERKSHELLWEFYIFNGHIYDYHPLKIARDIMQAFRPNIFIEKDTEYYEKDLKLKKLIEEHQNIWKYLIICIEFYIKKDK